MKSSTGLSAAWVIRSASRAALSSPHIAESLPKLKELTQSAGRSVATGESQLGGFTNTFPVTDSPLDTALFEPKSHTILPGRLRHVFLHTVARRANPTCAAAHTSSTRTAAWRPC